MTNQNKSHSGFTLIELSVSIVIIGLLLVAGLNLYNLYLKDKQISTTAERIEKIESALGTFVKNNGFYPCPAPIDSAPNTAGYAMATDCNAAVVAGVTETDGMNGNKIRVGAVPLRDLGLSESFLIDGWNRRLTYAVSVNLAKDAASFKDNEGAIDLVDLNGNSIIPVTNPRYAHFVVLSHGEDGKGAYATSGAQYKTCDSAEGKDQFNCIIEGKFKISDTRSFAAGTEYFDDYAGYSTSSAAKVGALFDTGWLPLNAKTLTINSDVDLSEFNSVIMQVKGSCGDGVTAVAPSNIYYYELSNPYTPNKSQRDGWSTVVEPDKIKFTLDYNDLGLSPVIATNCGVQYVGPNSGYGNPNGSIQIRFLVN